MGRTPETDQYMYSLTGQHPAEYEASKLEQRYRHAIPDVLRILAVDPADEVIEDIQQKLRASYGFQPRHKGSERVEKLLAAARAGSDRTAAAQVKELLDRVEGFRHVFLQHNAAAPRDYNTDASDALDITAKDMEPIIQDLVQQWHILKGDAHVFNGYASLLDKLTFTAATAAAINAARVGLVALSTIDVQVATVSGTAEAPPVAAAQVATICAEVFTVCGLMMAAIGMIINDVDLWVTGKTAIPEDFFKLAGSFASAKEQLGKLEKDMRGIKHNLEGIPARFRHIAAGARRLVLHR